MTTTPTTPETEEAPGAGTPVESREQDATSQHLGSYLSASVKRLRSGDASVLPVVAGLVILVIVFQVQDSSFLSAGNLTNLLVQAAVFILLGMAEVFVLLLGEIDLSIGYVAGVGAVITCELATSPHNVPWWIAILAGMAVTTAIGLLQGALITRLGLPSFVVTLAGLLGWEGVMLTLVNADSYATGGTIDITNPVLGDIVGGNLSVVAGWIVAAVVVGVFGLFAWQRDRNRRLAGVAAPPPSVTALKILGIAIAAVAVVAVCNTNRGRTVALEGVPWVILVILVILAGWTFLLGRTRFGRYLYAIGGNPEAARRAGVNLTRIRTGAFMLSGLTSGAAGIVYASRLGSISVSIDGGTLVLYAVAAAVIGGTSLFGGRGKMLHALIGGVVIAAIYNGMGLLGLSDGAQYMVTALVLLAAVTVDAVARRGRTAA